MLVLPVTTGAPHEPPPSSIADFQLLSLYPLTGADGTVGSEGPSNHDKEHDEFALDIRLR